MKSMIKNLSAITMLIIIISSCGNKKTADVAIPENAAIVVHINAASLSSKLSWAEIKNSEWFKMANEEGGPTGDFEKKLMEDPENSGVDLKSDMYFFVEMRGTNAYVVTQGKIKDGAKFDGTIKKMADGREIKKDGSMNYAGGKDGYITWTADKFIAVFAGESPRDMESGFGTRSRNKITEDSIFNYAKGLYSIKKNTSLGNDSRFASLLSEKGDMHFWMNAGSFIKSSIPMGLGSMFKATSLLEDNVSGYTVNFDNGKITASSRSWYNKELGALMKKYKPGNLNTDILKLIPGQNVTAVIAMNYPPEGLKEFLKLFGVDGIVNGFLGDAGLSIDDFVKANKGDLLFAVSDFSVTDKTKSYDFGGSPMTYTTAEPDAKVLFATSINDKPSFDKMIDVLKNEISKHGEAPEELNKIKYTVKDNWFIAGNAQESIDGFAAGSKTDHAFISKISGHPMGGYIDLQKILGNIKTKDAKGFEDVLSGNGKIWDNVIFYGGEMKDGATTGYFEINMIDKNTNSLKQLNSFLGTMAKSFKSSFEFDMNQPGLPAMDTAFVPPVITPAPAEVKPSN